MPKSQRQLHINDDEAYYLARRLADLERKSLTDLVVTALKFYDTALQAANAEGPNSAVNRSKA